MIGTLARTVLLGPDLAARAASAVVDEPAARWMLLQERETRRSYVREVLDPGKTEVREQSWMLLQDDRVRESFLREVLGAQPGGASPAVRWMLGEERVVRASYVTDVLRAPDGAVRTDVVWMLRQPDAVRERYVQAVVLSDAP